MFSFFRIYMSFAGGCSCSSHSHILHLETIFIMSFFICLLFLLCGERYPWQPVGLRFYFFVYIQRSFSHPDWSFCRGSPNTTVYSRFFLQMEMDLFTCFGDALSCCGRYKSCRSGSYWIFSCYFSLYSGGLKGSQSRQTVKYGHKSRETWNKESLCWRGPEAMYQSVSLFHRLKSGHDSIFHNHLKI